MGSNNNLVGLTTTTTTTKRNQPQPSPPPPPHLPMTTHTGSLAGSSEDLTPSVVQEGTCARIIVAYASKNLVCVQLPVMLLRALSPPSFLLLPLPGWRQNARCCMLKPPRMHEYAGFGARSNQDLQPDCCRSLGFRCPPVARKQFRFAVLQLGRFQSWGGFQSWGRGSASQCCSLAGFSPGEGGDEGICSWAGFSPGEGGVRGYALGAARVFTRAWWLLPRSENLSGQIADLKFKIWGMVC